MIIRINTDRPDIHFSRGRSNLFSVDKIAAMLTKDDLTLLSCGLYVSPNARPVEDPLAALKFVSAPTLSKTHRITVKFINEAGHDYKSNELTINF